MERMERVEKGGKGQADDEDFHIDICEDAHPLYDL